MANRIRIITWDLGCYDGRDHNDFVIPDNEFVSLNFEVEISGLSGADTYSLYLVNRNYFNNFPQRYVSNLYVVDKGVDIEILVSKIEKFINRVVSQDLYEADHVLKRLFSWEFSDNLVWEFEAALIEQKSDNVDYQQTIE